MDGFDCFAFLVFAVLIAAATFAVVTLGGLPGKLAARWGHPHATAVNAAAWISLVTLGALWPIAFVWAFVPWPSEGKPGETQ
jgi:hypothetical protein